MWFETFKIMVIKMISTVFKVQLALHYLQNYINESKTHQRQNLK